MNATIFTEPVLTLYRSQDVITANIAYISRELPALVMGDGVRAAIAGMCNEFDSALYDVLKEIRTLEDKLGMYPREEPFDPDVVNHDPKVTLSLIESWLRRELNRFFVYGTLAPVGPTNTSWRMSRGSVSRRPSPARCFRKAGARRRATRASFWTSAAAESKVFSSARRA